MEKEKLEPLEIVGTVSELAGVFAGTVVVTGKKIESWIRATMAPRAGEPNRLEKKPVQVRAKKEKRPARKKKPELEQAKKRSKSAKRTKSGPSRKRQTST